MERIPDRHPTDRKDIPEGQRRDLNEEFLAGANAGMRGPRPEQAGLRASDIKELVNRLPDLSGSELDQLPILPMGASLAEGATYIDLADPDRREFTAHGGTFTEADHYYVPKAAVDYELWNRLRGVSDPRRLNEGDIGREPPVGEVAPPGI